MNRSFLYRRAYTPYSEKPAACVVESNNGRSYAGVRIENISYPLTIPAIQSACAICLSEGEIPSVLYIENREFEQLDFWIKEFNLEVHEVEKLSIENLEDLLQPADDDFNALPKLKSLLSKAITPNSDFPVSAMLFTNGGYFEGVNVEVSDWTKGLCAERVVLAKAISAGITDFEKLEIHTKKGEISSPCGACRQVIAEFLPYHEIKLHHADGTLSEHLSIDMLPFNFKSASLKK